MDNTYIYREIFPPLTRHLDKPEITLITGSRQVGKTVLVEQLKEWLIEHKRVPDNQILTYNLDVISDWEICQDQTQFIRFLKDRARKKKLYVFIDEAQKAKDAAIFFKGVYDSNLNIKLILTGSSALELKSGLKESLAGRKRVFEIMPFNFREYASAVSKTDIFSEYLKGKKKGLSEIDQRTIKTLFSDYLVFGGYPRVVLSEDNEERKQVLSEIFTSYVEKDIVGFFVIKERLAFSRLVRLLAGQVGQLVNIHELTTNLSLNRLTTERYIGALRDTFIIKILMPYFRNTRQEIIKSNKIYFMDTGIMNFALENFSPFDNRLDRGQLLENAVFNELLFLTCNSLSKLRFWRTKQKTEVDFVIEKEGEVIPVETKLSIKSPKLTAGLRNFIEKYNPDRAYVVNLSISQRSVTHGKTRVYFLYPFELQREESW